jgi:hypothetical protein
MITPKLIRQKALKSWTNQTFLKSMLSKETFFPLLIPAGMVSSKQMMENFSIIQDNIEKLRAQDKKSLGAGYEILYTEINHRKLGNQLLPRQICIQTKQDFLFLIKKQKAFTLFEKGFNLLMASLPDLYPFLAQNPMMVLKYYDVLFDLILVCKFFIDNPNPLKYLRELDIPGVDTKFIENHKQVLKPMLDIILPSHAVNKKFVKISNHGFEKRFNLKYDMPLIRFRLLDSNLINDFRLQDISTTIEEFSCLALPIEKVFITENKINGLSFPMKPDSMVIFGLGYGIQALKHSSWLASKQIFYWGDIDTHGFAILSMMRQYFSNTQSFLMDRTTFFGFEKLWVKESKNQRSTGRLAHLTCDEQRLYQDLVDNTHGEMIRLEQERISYEYVKKHVTGL